MQVRAALVFLLLSATADIPVCEAQDSLASHENDPAPGKSYHFLTNVAQFRALSDRDFLGQCAFRLTGIVTLEDTNRNLMVLQDQTGAIAVNLGPEAQTSNLQVGRRISLEGLRCFPSVEGLPDFPYRPSGWDVRPSFEAPMNWGEYHLTRMRGYLHPPVTGEYTFWIASDNSSELWLSANDDPAKVRKLAFISRYAWVSPREWDHFPSQRSETILLQAGQTYYIEAFQEQTTYDEHLAVAWQGPGVGQSVIDNRYLTPWTNGLDPKAFTATNGVLREYWTNYTAGKLAGIAGPIPFESALSVEKMQVTVYGQESLPAARSVTLGQRLLADDNYRWVEAEGRVSFTGIDGDIASLELSDGEAQIQVRASGWNPEFLRRIRNSLVRVKGVCEGVHDQKGAFVLGMIWASKENSISVAETAKTNLSPTIPAPTPQAAPTNINPSMIGFYATRGVITFNDRVFDKDYLFVQEDSAAISVSLKGRHFANRFKVGQWVELAGALERGKNVAGINPLVVVEMGWRSMPVPVTQPVQAPVPANRDSRWSELEGVAHSVNSNGTVVLMTEGGPLSLWIGQTPSNYLSRYVDAKLCVRGVLSLATLDVPLLLIPSRSFVDVKEEAPEDPFGIPTRLIADAIPDDVEPLSAHRTRVAGEVTYRDAKSFFVEDASGGIRVQTLDAPTVDVGKAVEVAGFPAIRGPVQSLTEPLVRATGVIQHLEPKTLDLSEALSFRQSGTLVQVSANLIGQRVIGTSHVLELQEQQRIFQATLADGEEDMPTIAPGSRLRITGVCDNESIALPVAGKVTTDRLATSSLNIWLRNSSDVVVLKGPPWWTLRRTVALVGTLLLVLTGTLFWIRLLHWRLERQQAARLAFTKQILSGQESERRRIAANLHDALGQNLMVIVNQAQLAMQSTTNEPILRQRLGEISGVAVQAIEEVRQITLDLRPYHLDRLGLTEAIRATVGSASDNSPIQFASHADEIDTMFDKQSEIHVFRIVQEAVNNVIKHSGATEAAVVIKKRNATISISIRDNGLGFDVGRAQSPRLHDAGYGLSGITERVRILGGTLVIDSRPGQGTSLTVEISLPAP